MPFLKLAVPKGIIMWLNTFDKVKWLKNLKIVKWFKSGSDELKDVTYTSYYVQSLMKVANIQRTLNTLV
jgi:hypothetical protein